MNMINQRESTRIYKRLFMLANLLEFFEEVYESTDKGKPVNLVYTSSAKR